MFQFSGFPPADYVFINRCWPFRQRVSPFGHQRFFACTRLPAAFRSVPRPSSALDAQASPVRLLWLGLSCGDRARSCSYTNYIRVGCLLSGLSNPDLDRLSVRHLCRTDQRAFSYSVVKVLLQSFFSRLQRSLCNKRLSNRKPRLPVGGNGFWQLLGSFCFAETSIFAPVGLTRLELVTFPLSEGCSNRLSYRPGQLLSAVVQEFPLRGNIHRD
jgi:hypothetical protein